MCDPLVVWCLRARVRGRETIWRNASGSERSASACMYVSVCGSIDHLMNQSIRRSSSERASRSRERARSIDRWMRACVWVVSRQRWICPVDSQSRSQGCGCVERERARVLCSALLSCVLSVLSDLHARRVSRVARRRLIFLPSLLAARASSLQYSPRATRKSSRASVNQRARINGEERSIFSFSACSFSVRFST